MQSLFERIQKAFHTSSPDIVYGRATERQHIQSFLEGPDTVLHVTGKPGTGKTCTVKHMLNSARYTYINYYYEPKINEVLKNIIGNEKNVMRDEKNVMRDKKSSRARKNT